MANNMAIIPKQMFPWESVQRSKHDDDEVEDVWPSSQAIIPRSAGSRYMDIVLPPPGFSVWDMPQSKLQTTAVAATFVAATLLVTGLAGAGMLAVLVTGFVVSAAVLLLVTVCTALVALIVTGVPVGYAAWQLLSRYQQFKFGLGLDGGDHGWSGGHSDHDD